MIEFLRYHKSLLLAVAFGSAALLLPIDPLPLRAAAAWNCGVLAFICQVALMMRRAGCASDLRKQARKLDVSGLVLMSAMVVAAFLSLALSLSLQFESRKAEGWEHHVGYGMALGTVVMSWVFVQTMFAVHYAHHYYSHDLEEDDPDDSQEDDDAADDDEGGLEFPQGQTQGEEPDFIDFFYFSCVIGMTFQVSDVQVTRHHMRRRVLAHGIIAFFFNTFILALSVNIAAGLFER